MTMISVFGSSGFIGSKFCELYSNDVIKIDRDAYANHSNDILYLISTTHNYHVFDDATLDIKTNLLHLAQVLENVKTYQDNNHEPTLNLISSWFVLGDQNLEFDYTQGTSTQAYCNPKGFYSITKRCAEQLVESYCKTFKIKYRIIRLCNVYGPSDNYSKKKNALQFLINELKQDNPIELYFNGEFYRDYMHVTDVCTAIKLIIDKGSYNTIYNVAPQKPYKFKYLIDYIIEHTNSKSKVTAVEASDFHKLVQVKNCHMDSSDLQALGFHEEYTIEKGLEELCQN